jgi:hypothetical protein
MHICIKCGYVGIGMLLAFIISNWMGIHEFGRIGAVVIGVGGGVLGYLFALGLFSSDSGHSDTHRAATVANSFPAQPRRD